MPARFNVAKLREVFDHENLQSAAKRLQKDWKGVNGLLDALESDAQGGILGSTNDIAERVEAFGNNVIPEPEGETFYEMFMETFEDATVQVLMVSATVSLGVGMYEDFATGWIEGAAIFMAVFIVAMVTAVNNYQKQEQFRVLSFVSGNIDVKVCRGGKGGKMEAVSIREIVVGDVVRIEVGDKVPADGIFLSGSDVAVDESGMTGESDLVEKGAGGGVTSFLISGSNVVSGYCDMLVVRVGMSSSIGMSARAQKHADTPLQEKLTELADQIGYGGMGAAAATFLVMMAMWWLYPDNREEGLLQTVINAVILAVAIVAVAVPEGLPLAVVISLAFSSQKMMKDNNLIRHLDACETMGNTTNICSDKTGTLTQNKMTFVEGYIGGAKCDSPPEIRSKVTDDLATAITSNSTAFLGADGSVIGNITEGALLKWLDGLGYNVNAMREENIDADRDRLFTFSSTHKRMSILCLEAKKNKGGTLYTKGASEKVLEICTHITDRKGDAVKLDAKKRQEVTKCINNMAAKQLRVLAVAHRRVTWGDVNRPRDVLEKDLTLDGLFGIKDPLRPDVPAAVAACKKAGIFVRMITGDNINTAKAIAKEAGILTEGGLAMEGIEFRALTPAQLDAIIPKLQVLARASPQDKYILVTRLNGNQLPTSAEEWLIEHPGHNFVKEKSILLPGFRDEWEEVYGAGEVVGVTGDGTNDAPALLAANVGLSMGISGTDVAKHASDIIIMDDNFSSIVKAVMWGRSVFDNIRKFLQFQLTVNVVALIITFLSAFSGGAPPLNAVMMLWINLIMDTMGALALGTEAPTMELLNRKPYKRDSPLINIVMWRNIFFQSVFQILLLGYLLTPEGASDFGVEYKGTDMKHQTVIFNVFVLCQVFNEFNARSIGDDKDVFRGLFTNPIFVGIIIATVAVQYGLVEYGGDFFRTSSLNQDQWIKSALLASLTLPIGGLMRIFPLREREDSFAPTNFVGAITAERTKENLGVSLTMLLWIGVVVASPAMVWQEFQGAWLPRIEQYM